jgi:hypothetical protein
LPIVVNDKVIGAIGVSGVTAQQDGQIAKAGADACPKSWGSQRATPDVGQQCTGALSAPQEVA